MMDFFSNKEESTNWTIPVLSKVSNDLRLVAQMVTTLSVMIIFCCNKLYFLYFSLMKNGET